MNIFFYSSLIQNFIMELILYFRMSYVDVDFLVFLILFEFIGKMSTISVNQKLCLLVLLYFSSYHSLLISVV